MHELAICQALLDEVERVARAQHAERIAAVHVRCGVLAGVEPELLHRAYEVARAGTLADDAALTIEDSPVRVYCPRCRSESSELLLMSVELIAADGARS
jgi:hydrogenase nickel incorporation protein HypA/HybF